MADAADVRSLDAVREWHASLTTYGEGLAEALAGVSLEIRRAFDWIEEQRDRWQQAIRDCEQEVTRAKAELSQKKFKTWDGRDPDTTVEERKLRRAQARLEHAEDQVQKCRQWLARLPRVIDEVYTGVAHRLSNLIEADLPKALAQLAQRIVALERYTQERTDYAAAPSAASVNALTPADAPPAAAASAAPAPTPSPPPEQAP